VDNLAEACFYTDADTVSERLYSMALPLAHLFASVPGTSGRGSAHRSLGLLATVLRRWDDAETHFQAAIHLNDERGYRLMVTRSRRCYADMLLRRDAPGDRERALALLEQALEGAQKLGQTLVTEECLSLKVKTQGLDASTMSLYTSIDRLASDVTEAPPPVWRDAVAPDGTVTIMFSDIEDSTVLTERLGDAAWQDLLREHDAIILSCVETHDGFVVKHLGDGFMLAFQSARKALDCATAIQRSIAGDGATSEPVRVRIGLHAGEVVREKDDFFGKNVVLASRVAGQAKGGEILASSVLRALVESSVDASTFGEPREVSLKGLEGTHVLHPMMWDTTLDSDAEAAAGSAV
jgi:eukaryotic-like serine/threonine-protein kinase